MKLHIKNGRLIDPANNIDDKQDLFIAEDKIVGIGHAPKNFYASKIIDATNLVVAPGLIDLSVRLCEPGYKYKTILMSEMQAAIQGGITSLICPPDIDPILDEPRLVEMLIYRAKSFNQVHVYPLGALTIGLNGKILTEMSELTEAGCIGFSQGTKPILDTSVLLNALQYAKTFNYSVWLLPIEPYLGNHGIAHGGSIAARLGLSEIPIISETIALYTIFELVRATQARVHLCRMSVAAGIELVQAAKREGLPITCDVSAHHVHLSEINIGFFDTNARINPPFRSEHDREVICAALLDGTIDAICSDHTPINNDKKLVPFGEASPGVTGLELLLSLALKWATENKNIHSANIFSKAIAKITIDAARVAGLSSGTLCVGAIADICLFDPYARWTVEACTLASQSKHTPFLGCELIGKVKKTIISGNIVFEQ